MEFVRKYIQAAKAVAAPPQMTPEASRIIAEEYTRLRSTNLDDSHLAPTQPITARSLETMIRLSAAHAKARFDSKVTKEDALAAIELIQYAIFERVEDKEKKKRKAEDSDGSDVEMVELDGDEEANGENGHDGNAAGEEGNPPKRIRSSVQDEPERMDEDSGVDRVVVLEPGEISDER